MVGAIAFLVGILALAPADSSTSELAPLLLEGAELHESLVTLDLSEIRHVPAAVLESNPQLSDHHEFIHAVGGGSSQGSRDGRGVRRALYAIYRAEKDLGFYGLEAASEADADRLEKALRETWAHNAKIDRARVHRGNLALLVIWHDGVSEDCWEAVNAVVAERLVEP